MESLFPIHSTKPLAEIILDRLHKSKPMTENTRKRLRCGKLWCLDPITQEKIYICPVCAKEYKTSNGLKYHLNGHAAESFPQGYFWKRMNVDAEEEEDEKEKGKKELMQEEKKAFQCMVEGCQNSYASLGGLKYHRQKRHGGDHHHHGDGKLVHV
ncbi:hypothetical protein BDR26DRAFT_860736 [Obelidium mucronatum]|nr:hypothetical protein BDR26DRAFT_860736 [Obelidium mucronatum]